MKREPVSVLFLGLSSVALPNTGAEGALTGLTRTCLEGRAPGVAWRCTGAPLGPSRRMARDALALVEVHQPDFVVLHLAASAFAYEFPIERVRRRWPAVYRPAKAISERLHQLARFSLPDTAPPRRLIFGVPQWLALRTIGGDTAIPVEHAVANTRETIEALTQSEDIHLICRLPVGRAKASKARARRYQERIARHNSAIVDVCRQHRVPFLDLPRELEERGLRVQHQRDGLHMDDATERFEADLLAPQVVAMLDIEPVLERKAIAGPGHEPV